MSAVSSPRTPRVVLYEGPGGQELSAERRFEVLESLLRGGYQVTRTAAGDAGAVSAPDGRDLVVVGEAAGEDSIFERASRPAETGGESVTVHFRDISGAEPAAVLEKVAEVGETAGATRPGEWKPWFPVIDFDRCTNCMQCLSFCLFDVYGVDGESNIEVQNPDKCKTSCPACSRVCPEVAILFPKYGSGPINGDAVNQEDVEREKMKVDISALLGGDIYSMLRDRHERAASRFSKERDEDKALKERLRCLKKLQGEVEIPPEVLMSLPSLDEIQHNAERARKAADAALEARKEREDRGRTAAASSPE